MAAFLRRLTVPGSERGLSGSRFLQDPRSLLLAAADRPAWISAAIDVVMLVAVAVVSLQIALFLAASMYTHTNILFIGDYSLARHLDGSVLRPFAYRVLTDWSARLVLALHLPDFAIAPLDQVVAKACPTQRAIPAATCEQIKAFVMVATAFAWGFLITTYLLARRFIGGYFWSIVTTLLAAFIVNALLLETFGQPYDFTTLFFASTLFMLAARQRDLGFALLLVGACLAKESLVLFALIYAMIGLGYRPIRQVALNCCLQGAIFVAVYALERFWFAGNGGASMYHNLPAHLKYLIDNSTVYAISATLFFCVLLFYRLPRKPVVLQRAMLILPVMLLLYFAGGQPGEFRIIVDVFPIVLLPIADSLRRLCGGGDHADVAAYQWPPVTRGLTPRNSTPAAAHNR